MSVRDELEQLQLSEIAHLRKCLEQTTGQIMALANERDELRAEVQRERWQRQRAEDDVTDLTRQLSEARRQIGIAKSDQHISNSARATIQRRKEGGRW